MIADVLKRARLEGVELYLENDQLRYRVKEGKLSAELRQELVSHKETILSLLRGQIEVDPDIPVVPREGALACSFAQQRLWFVDQLEGGSAQYNIPAALRLRGSLDFDALQRAVDTIVERHEVLCTVYRVEEGAPVQVVRPFRSVAIERLDVTEERVQTLAAEEAQATFDLAGDVMLRVRLLTIANDDHVLLFTMHHIASDGWSMGVLVREFVALYGAYSERRENPLPALPIQYADYASWQRGHDVNAQVEYWKKRLDGIPQLHSLTLDKPRGARQSFVAQKHQQRIDRALVEKLTQLGRDEDATLFMVLQSAFATLLGRWSNSSDVVMAVPTAGRTMAAVEPLIGFFINTLVFRTELAAHDTFRSLLGRAKRDTLDAHANQQVPFEMLVDELKPERALSYNPLAQIKFVLQNHRETGNAFALPGLSIEPLANGVERVRFDLDLTASESTDGLTLNWTFKDELFERATIERMAAAFRVMLEGIAANPDAHVRALPLLDETQTGELLALSRGATNLEGRDACVHALFEAQAARTPDAIAVLAGARRLTYRELNAQANRLAHYLIEEGIEPCTRVGLYVERSADVLIGMLGILKAGATYVPFEPGNTAERLRHIIDNGEIETVLVQSHLAGKLPVKGIDVVLLDDAEWLDDYDAANPNVAVSSDDSAYVIYTSGSTGVPKGVEITHGGLVDYLAFASQRYYAEPLTGSLVVTSHGFDITVPSLYVPLLRGGSVTLTTPGEELMQLAEALSDDKNTYLLRMTPMHLTGALALLSTANRQPSTANHTFVIGGESFPAALAREAQAQFPNAQIYNHYGPTETVVGCAMFDVTANLATLGERIPIGKPMDNTRLYVLSEAMQLAPIGVPGELCIGGAGVARGYVNQPELTSAKFVEFDGTRVYKTGDLVRRLPSGDLEFLGRFDDQIKIRGFRIELGEIESVLKAEEGVRDALVIAQGEGENKSLVAYVVGEANESALRMRLKQALPEYMVPTGWCFLEAFPLNANGKVDRKALPAIDRAAAAQHIEPATETEARLAAIWRDVLKLEALPSVTANFFELGGHSLLATRVISAVTQSFHKSMPVRTLFEHNSVRALAAFLDAQEESGPVQIRKARRTFPATALQQGMHFHEQIDRTAYVTQIAARFRGALDTTQLRTSWQKTVTRHDALRTFFAEQEGVLQQVIVPHAPLAWHEEDLTALDADAQSARIEAYRREDRERGFDLAEPGLQRVALFRLDDERTQLVWTYHAIILDSESAARVLCEAFGNTAAAAPAIDGYMQWVAARDVDASKQFWRDTLGDLDAPTRLPLDRDRGGYREHVLTPRRDTIAALDAFAKANDTDVQTVVLLAWGYLLHRYAGESDVTFGAVQSARGIDVDGIRAMAGAFTNIVPVRVSFGGDATPSKLVSALARFRHDAQQHGHLPLTDIQQQTRVARGVSMFDTLVVLNDTALEADLEAASKLSIEQLDEVEPTHYAVTLTVTNDGGLTLRCGTSEVSEDTVRRLLAHLGRVIEQLADCADLARLDLMTEDDRATMARYYEPVDIDFERGVHELFEDYVARTPDAPALEYREQHLSYRELNEAANRLAHYLIEQGIGPEVPVGLCADRSVEMMVGILGVIKAGGAYVPLDPSYPAARLQHIVTDAGMPIVLTQSHLLDRVPAGPNILALDSAGELLGAYPVTNPDIRSRGWTSSNLVYIIYTSGSTGLPKGVLVEHRHVQTQYASIHQRYQTTPGGYRVLSVCSFGFDPFVEEMCLALLAGGTMVFSPDGLSISADRFWPMVLEKRISSIMMPTSYFNYLCSELTAEEAESVKKTLQLLIIGGEALLSEHAARWQRLIGPGVAFWNGYGPTEITVFATAFEVGSAKLEEGKNPPIGRALPSYYCYVVDANGSLCPIGVPGELWVGGPGVTRGYCKREELTAERFLDNPFGEGRIYRTGDLVRMPANGEIEYLGRMDQQVKIRGFRVELGEIETQLLQSGKLKEALVIAQGKSGEAALIAYAVPNDFDENQRVLVETLRAFLAKSLPPFMVPDLFVVMEKLPRTVNGKIDKRALPAPDRNAARDVVAPSTPTEMQLAKIWQDVLKLDREPGATENFFELGGHSLLGMRVATAVSAAFQKTIAVRALFTFATIQTLAAHIDAQDSSEHVKIKKSARQVDALPLSFAQQRLWFVDQLEGGSAHYNMPVALRLTGLVDADAMQYALTQILNRHEILRTTYHMRDGEGVQIVSPAREFPLVRFDLTGWDEAMQQAEVDRLAREDASQVFDLARDLMMRVTLVTLSPDDHVLLFAMHHVASDGWSLGVLAREFTALYESFRKGAPSPLKPLEIQYADYANWQREDLGAETIDRQLGYWKTQLAGVPQLHSLPLDMPRTAIRSLAGENMKQVLPMELLNSLRQLAQANNATLFMLMETAFALLLGRWSNEHDIVLGTPTAGRTHKDLEPLIGFFVNTLLLRNDLSGPVSFVELLARTQRMALDAYSNQDVPFEAVVDELKPERNLSHTTLFQITFAFENNDKPVLQLGGIEASTVTKSYHLAKFDLNFAAAETPDGLGLSWSYASSLFHRETIERMAASFAVLLQEIVAHPAEDIRTLRLAPAADLELVRAWNARQTPFPQTTVHGQFESHVRRAPDAIALVHGEATLTYAELNRRANRIAHWLLAQGVALEEIVAVSMERSLDLPAAMLGILKAGAAYLPLDPSWPAARTEAMIADSRAKIVLTQELVDEALRVTSDDADLALDLTPSNLCHVIYTSGSTGTPKGTMIEHGGTVRLVVGTHHVSFGPEDRVMHASTPSFDAATFEIWGALLNGSALVLYPEKVLDLHALNRELEEKEVTLLFLTAGLFEQWSQQVPKLEKLRHVLTGGDVFSPRAVERVYRALPEVVVSNAYGPTENTSFTTCYAIPRDHDFARPVPIGPAVNGTTVHVLNEAMTPVPLRAIGELYTGGAGVARGYLWQPELTAAKFVTHLETGERLYKTGDLVRMVDGGVLEFIGRADDQVKIRGFRIEPGEIAAQLLRLDDVDDALVVTRGQGAGKRLVAYVVGSTTADSVRARLKQNLPDYMIPSAFVVLEAMPLTPAGKIDRAALPEPELQQADAYVAPRTETERQLAAIWQQLLKLDRVGIEDNFFAIGGDSILSIQAVSRANQAGIGITTRQLFEHQTIAALAAAAGGVAIDTPQEAVTGALELLPIQQEFLRETVDPQHFNQSVLLATPPSFTFGFVRQMTEALLRRHDALRLRFHGTTAEHAELTDDMLDASAILEPLHNVAERCDYHQRRFNLAEGPLFKGIYFEGDGEGRLFLLAHHIVVDGVSWRILLADIERAWRQFEAGEPIELRAKTSSYQQWGDALAEYAASPALQQEKAYWLSQYEHAAEPLPVDMVPDEAPTGDSARRERIRLNADETQALLQRCAHAYRTSINELLLSGVYLGLRKWAHANVFRFTLEGHGREPLFDHLDTTQTVGWFTTAYPLTLHAGGADVATVIKSVKEQYRAIPHNGIGFGVLREIAKDADLIARDSVARPQIVFNYLGQFDQSVNSDTAFQGAPESTGVSHSERQHRTHQLVLNGKVAGGELVFGLDYSDLQYRPATMVALRESIEAGLRAVIDHCLSVERGAFTPSDFPLARVSQQRLDEWQREYPNLTKLYPATAMQQGMYFHAQLDRSAYVTQMFPTLEGRLSPERFREAWQAVTNRHDIFRTVFASGDDVLHQVVVSEATVAWHEEDWRQLSADEQAERFKKYRAADKAAGFDLTRAPLHRIALFRLADERWQFLWTHHHLLLDGWSIPRVYQDVMLAYHGQQLSAPREFEGYVRWLQTRNIDDARAWWRSVLGDFESATPLGVDKLPAESMREHRERYVTFTDEESQRLEAFARSHNTTLNTVMQLAWGYLLHRYSGQNDVVFGTVISGRPAEVAGVEEMVGLFINAIPVKVSFAGDEATPALLGAVHRAFQESQQWGWLPLPEVQRQSGVRATEPLFRTVMAFENYPLDTALSHDDAPAREFRIAKAQAEEGRTNYKLVMVASYRTNLKIRCDWRSDEFSTATIERLMEHLQTILRRMPDAESVADIDLLGDAERVQLAAWNDTEAPSYDRCVHELFEEQAARTPHNIAVVDGERTIIYAQLDADANAVAAQLVAQGVGEGSIVGLSLDRSIEEITGILACWKAGAAYVPLDPSYPAERLQYMIEDSGAKVILTTAAVRNALATPPLAKTPARRSPAAPAYVIYTSGSTGQPKGAVNTHAALANLCAWHHRKFEPTAESCGAHLISISFDPSVYDVWPYLLRGGRIAIVSDEERAEPLRLAERFETDRITHCIFPTALLEHLAQQDVPESRWRHLEAIIVGGDKLSGYRVPKGCTAKLVNHYGPTEAAVVATTFDVEPGCDSAPPIGTPIDNVTIHVLDARGRVVPAGVAGELHIGGAGLAAGYLHRPELTAERFVTVRGERLYKSGDLVRRLPDGNIEFLGRIDDQVKIRGFRVELGEIVARLLQCDGVANAIVLARGEGAAHKQLVAYVVGFATDDALRTQLRQTLPDYMIPAAFVFMDAFPLTTNGKVDKGALPDPEFTVGAQTAARTSTESELVSVWQELLGYAPVGIDDNFFERGGHSLVATQAIARIRRRCNVELPLVALFENPTPAALARVIDGLRGTLPAAEAIEPLGDYSDVPLSFAQQRLWFIDQFEEGSASYNIHLGFKVRGEFHLDLFERALTAVAQRQSILRTRFRATETGARQEILDAIELPVRFVECDREAASEAQKFDRTLPFDMSGGLLWRGAVYRVDADEHWIHFTIHHAITDAWSNGILKMEIVDAYETLVRGEELQLEPLPLQYADYAAWQQRTLDESRLEQLMAYWRTRLDGMPKQHGLPLDFARPKVLGRQSGAVPFELDAATLQSLQRLCEQSGTTMYMLLVAAFSVLVSRLSGKDDVVIGAPIANRPSAELERVIGFFINTAVLRVGVDGARSFAQVLADVRGVMLGAAQHQECPFERIVAELAPERTSAHPLFQLCFTYNNTPTRSKEARVIDVESLAAGDEASTKFDLLLSVDEPQERLAGRLYFNAELFKRSTIESWAAKLTKLLAAVARDPQQRVEAIELADKVALPSVRRVARATR